LEVHYQDGTLIFNLHP